MRFTVTQTDFLEAFARVSPAVPAKSTMPILSNILMELEGNTLRMVATDLDVSVLTHVQVNGEADGSISVAAKKVGDIVRELEGKNLECNVDENLNLQIKAGEGRYQVPGVNAQDFPQLPDFEGATEVTLPVKKLDSLIQRTSFAVSRDELRPALTGVFVQIKANELRAVSTDGHRLVQIIDHGFSFDGELRELIIPVKALDMIRRNLPNEGDVVIGIGASQIQVQLETATLYSRLIEGKYPHYESVIPKDNKDLLVTKTDALIRAVKRAQIFANPISKQVVFNLNSGSLEITSEDLELGGRGREVVEVDYKGEEKVIGYNAGYVQDILKQVKIEEIRFELGGPTHAGIIRPTEQADQEDFLMLIMPVRLS